MYIYIYTYTYIILYVFITLGSCRQLTTERNSVTCEKQLPLLFHNYRPLSEQAVVRGCLAVPEDARG